MFPHPTIFLLGSGNVAWQLSRAFAEKRCKFLGMYSRTFQNTRKLATRLQCPVVKDVSKAPTHADIYLICTSDDAIAPVSALLPKHGGMTIHVSGSAAMEDIDKKHRRRAVMYPLQTFNKNRTMNLNEVPIFIETENEDDMRFLTYFAQLISDNVVPMNYEQRKILHVAAVFACNFTNFMYSLAAEFLQKHELDFQLLFPLIVETAKRLENINNPMLFQTGPAVRNDLQTIQKHLDLLKEQPQLRELYEIVSKAILERNKT
jgi:predicted short-subunit dehydrogenase-like oxidoreductase (DUF2520 family)